MPETAQNRPLTVVYTGLLGGVVALLLTLMGMVEGMSRREIITGVLTLGPGLLAIVAVVTGTVAARRGRVHGTGFALLAGLAAGFIVSALLGLLVLVGQKVNLRFVLVNASPTLFQLLLWGQPTGRGLGMLLMAGLLLGGLGGLMAVLRDNLRKPLVSGLSTMLTIGLFAELLRQILAGLGFSAGLLNTLFTARGLTGTGAVVWFVVGAAISVAWGPVVIPIRHRLDALDPARRRVVNAAGMAVGFLVLLLLPLVIGRFLSNALVLVGLFALMGWGLNLELGWAGLLDLGFVAFFAMGAYTVALLTSPTVGVMWSFWQALPVAVIASVLSGVLLGVPVLGVRGDYLAIATLGFGEIVRLLVLSDWLKPWTGGAQGRTRIARPEIGDFVINDPEHFYYLVLAACVLALVFVARLRNTKLGRAWRAIREDEDVAQAMGINLVQTKLLAYGLGAGLAGLAGAIFGAFVGSIFPASFHLLVSINVLALIIVGGVGSLPGVFLGALTLVGLPELLREFQEYRLFVYGAVLIAMMLLRPEGLLPERAAFPRSQPVGRASQVPAGAPRAAAPGQGG